MNGQLFENGLAGQLERTAWTFIKTVVDTTLDPFLILDPQLRVIAANKCFYQFFKVAWKDTENRLIYNLGEGQWNIPRLRKLLEEILPKKTYFKNFQIEHSFPKIGNKVMRLNGRQIYERAGIPETVLTPMILLVVEDITEQEALKNKLVLADKLAALGKLSGSLVHELRNSLSVIRNSTYSLKMFGFQDKRIQRTLLTLGKEGERMDQIINDILGFAFGFAQMHKPGKVKKDIGKIIKKSLGEAVIPKNIKINLKFGKIPLIFVEEIHMSQLFSNIIKNAVEAMPHGGTLTIAAGKRNNYAVVSVQDTGVGIKKNNLAKIFEPLFSTKSQGTGLGLMVCQRIIKLYNGNINAQSKLGKGTKFVIEIPIRRRAVQKLSLN